MPRVRRNDSVWTETHKNGKVVRIDYDCEEVECFFYNSRSYEMIELDQFQDYHFNDNLNQWQLPEV